MQPSRKISTRIARFAAGGGGGWIKKAKGGKEAIKEKRGRKGGMKGKGGGKGGVEGGRGKEGERGEGERGRGEEGVGKRSRGRDEGERGGKSNPSQLLQSESKICDRKGRKFSTRIARIDSDCKN